MHASALDRRDFLRTGASLALGAAALAPDHLGARQHADEGPPASAQEALHRLLAGNERFVRGRPRHPHEAASWRRAIAKGQRPFATVIGCADSRVPPEVLFDQGLGDLFVIRVAGHAVDDNILGSLQYASLHLHTPLCVVLGHESCGAVIAALEAHAGVSHEPERINRLIKHMLPALEGMPFDGGGAEIVMQAVERNVRWTLQQLAEAGVAGEIGRAGTALVGAVYDLDEGRVRLLA